MRKKALKKVFEGMSERDKQAFYKYYEIFRKMAEEGVPLEKMVKELVEWGIPKTKWKDASKLAKTYFSLKALVKKDLGRGTFAPYEDIKIMKLWLNRRGIKIDEPKKIIEEFERRFAQSIAMDVEEAREEILNALKEEFPLFYNEYKITLENAPPYRIFLTYVELKRFIETLKKL